MKHFIKIKVFFNTKDIKLKPKDNFDFIILPEISNGGYSNLLLNKSYLKINDNIINDIIELSKQFSTTFIIPLPIKSKKKYNSALVIRNGQIIKKYNKIHLFNPLNENKLFTNGNKLCIWEEKIKDTKFKCGVIICYDLRFPELTRLLALKNINILFVPARWPSKREEHWKTLLKARAIENHIFVVGINSNDSEGGNSFCFSPLGELIFTNSNNFKLSSYTIKLDLSDIPKSKLILDTLRDKKINIKWSKNEKYTN